MKIKQSLRRLLAVLLCFSMLWCFALPAWADDEDDETSASEAEGKAAIADLSSKYDELQKQQEAVQAQINAASGKKQAQLAIKKQLDNNIALIREQIDVLTAKIALLEQEIEDRQTEIDTLGVDIDKNYESFKRRVRAMYMSNNTTNLGLLLGAESYSEFLTRAEVLKRVSNHDNELIDGLVAKMSRVRDAKKELEADMDDLAASKVEVEAKKQQLNTQLASTNNQIQDLAAQEKEYLANQAELKKQMQEVQDEIAAIYRQIGSNGEYVGGQFAWPLPGFYSISCAYGLRFQGSDFHTGTDISGSGVYGKTIVAANTGTVAFVQTTYVPNRGYGKYLIIDHGGGYSTLYGHCSDIFVQVGDTVSKGDPIAAVGSTGWSTGPHLHFEIRIDGVAKNPMTYFTKA